MIRNTTRARSTRAIAALASFALILFSASSSPALTVPAYNSLPGAFAKLFLDFDGVDFGSTVWSSSEISLPGVRPAYSINADTSTFTSTELSNIFEIWSRVAEAYSPFNINVTTVDPGNYNRYESAHVVISGDNSWYSTTAGGVAKVDGFTSFSTAMVQRTSWVFPGNLNNGFPQTVADAAIHEAGHMFGLEHQPLFDSNGVVTQAYDPGDSLRAPNMGVAYSAQRGLWAIGPDKDSSTVDNNDISVVAEMGLFTNNFGFIPDETGTSIATAPQINLSSTPLRGVIGNILVGTASNDIDYFRLNLNALSQVSINIDVAQFGPMLDTKLILLDSLGASFYTSDPALTTSPISRNGLKSSFSGVLAAGTYYLDITSHGGYTYSLGSGATDRFLQDTGQYFITGSAIAVPEPTSIALGGLGVVALVARKRQLQGTLCKKHCEASPPWRI
jgi:hypothetical protein